MPTYLKHQRPHVTVDDVRALEELIDATPTQFADEEERRHAQPRWAAINGAQGVRIKRLWLDNHASGLTVSRH